MKRRLLSAFLAVMMVLTMAPVAFAADEDADIHVSSYAELVNAINGSTGADYRIALDTEPQTEP